MKIYAGKVYYHSSKKTHKAWNKICSISGCFIWLLRLCL